MIPVLHESTLETQGTYGIGTMADTISCEVTEERNGIYELKLTYPVNAPLFKELKPERVILAKPNDTSDDQFFRIYRITTPIGGVATIYAQHISYDLCNIAVLPFSDENISPALALTRIFTNNPTPNTRFSAVTDMTGAKAFGVKQPQSIRACLGGASGSMLDVWGGEYEWDNFNVSLHQHRGADNGVTILYGKNLTALDHNRDVTEVYTDILPYATYTDEESIEHIITLPEAVIPLSDTQLEHEKTLIKDFTEYFNNEPVTEERLRGITNAFIESTILGFSNPTVTISFEPLWKTSEYAAVLEQVGLCDTVTVKHSELNISAKTKVITTVYDTLNEKYISITIGAAKASMINDISAVQRAEKDTKQKIDRFPALIGNAIKNATDRITGQNGGHVVINSRNNKPYEILIMDTDDIDTAVNVWRWNLSGLGFSSTGYAGPYTTAITADGEIVADFITSGTLIANIIKAGILSSQDGSSWWDLETGEISLAAYATNEQLDTVTVTIAGVSETVATVNERASQLQTSFEGLNSFVYSLNETVETITDELGNTSSEIADLRAEYSRLQQTVDGITVEVGSQYSGGINFIENSSGLNGLSDDWTYSGTVRADASTDVQNNTASDSAFLLSDNSELSQEISGLMPNTSYSFSFRAKKTAGDYTSSVSVIVGDQTIYAMNTTEICDWKEYSIRINSVPEGIATIRIYNRAGQLYVSDLMFVEGNTSKKWTPAPNEIYTNEVKIDKRGIAVSNSQSSQKTVITNTEFAGYYNNEVIFTLNRDETQTKKTTVDGELTVGNVKFIPTGSVHGLNIVVLD